MSEDSKTLSEVLAENEARTGDDTPWLDLDAEKYSGDIADLGLTEDQETAFLQALWSIMRAMVDLGFDVNICGQILSEFNSIAEEKIGALDSIPSTNSEKPSSTGKASSE